MSPLCRNRVAQSQSLCLLNSSQMPCFQQYVAAERAKDVIYLPDGELESQLPEAVLDVVLVTTGTSPVKVNGADRC